MREVILVGASFGGVIAFELSRSLHAAGAEPRIKALALLDSPCLPVAIKPSAHDFLRDLFGIPTSIDAIPQSPECSGDGGASVWDAQVSRLASEVEDILKNASAHDRARVQRHDWRKLLDVYVENVLALNAHHSTNQAVFDCPALYVRATSSAFTKQAERWSMNVPSIKIVDVESTHSDVCAGPLGEEIAAELSALIL
jgi:thioesterase domain-containing protein